MPGVPRGNAWARFLATSCREARSSIKTGTANACEAQCEHGEEKLYEIQIATKAKRLLQTNSLFAILIFDTSYQ